MRHTLPYLRFVWKRVVNRCVCCQEHHKLEITMLSQNVSMLYSFFLSRDKRETRMPMLLVQSFFICSAYLFFLKFVCLQCFDAVGWATGGHPACKKQEWWGAGVVVSLEQDADLHMAQLMPLPLTVSCFSKIQIGFTFLVPADLGSPGKRAVKRVCVLCAL